MPKLTKSEIRAYTTLAGSHFFDRKTLSFFGETMKDYSSRYHAATDTNILIRRRSNAGPRVYVYEPESAEKRAGLVEIRNASPANTTQEIIDLFELQTTEATEATEAEFFTMLEEASK